MARVLFSLQIVVLIFVAPFLPGIPPDLWNIGVALLVLIVVLPLLAVSAIWGPFAVAQSLSDAFGYQRLGSGAPLSLRVWKTLVEVFPMTGLLTISLAFVAMMNNLRASEGLYSLFFAFGWSALTLTLFSILKQVVEGLSTRPGVAEELPTPFAEHYGLTPREQDVARLLVRGMTYNQIGESLFVSPATVKTHVLHIYEKTRSASKAQLSALIRGFGS